MKYKKNLVVLSVVVIFFILAISLTLASNDHGKKQNRGNETNHSSNETQKENKTMTYGKCVSNFTKIKNSCFRLFKEDYKECRFIVKNATKTDVNGTIIPVNKTEIKAKFFECKSIYKETLESCKVDFKASKETCNQYRCKKHQVFINNTCVKEQ